jgi:hypothetical protein
MNLRVYAILRIHREENSDKRKCKMKGAALIQTCAFRPDVPIQHADDVAGDGQPDAAATAGA